MTSLPPETTSDLSDWDGNVLQWGTLREVMHGEALEGQVRLAEVADKPHVFGIGALDQLRGEILIADSTAWVATVHDGDRVATRRADLNGDTAVFLAVAEVPRWTEVTVDHDVPADEFDDFIGATIRRAGLENAETVPVVVEGHFPTLELHVLNGQCPFAEVTTAIEGASPPHRTALHEAQGLLVGFYSENGAGRITHHWTRTHLHALVGPAEEPVVGHVDAVTVKAGTVVRVPGYGA